MELLVVIAIISSLMAIMLPAVQAARETSRRMACRNHLKQIGLAIHNYYSAMNHFPSSGNNGTIARSGSHPATARSAPFQQAGMFFQILPYLEQQSAYQSDDVTIRGTAVAEYFCASRRAPRIRANTDQTPLGLNDYAMPVWKDATQGAGFGGTSNGCWNFWDDAQGDNSNHPYYRNTIFVRGGKGSTAFPPGRLAEVTDGTSNVLMVSEKFMDPSRYEPQPLASDPPQPPWPTLAFTDMGYFQGWNWSTLRCSMYGPFQDQPYGAIAYWQMFGSAHDTAMNALFADGSVRSISYSILNPVFQLLCRKNDGAQIDASGL